MFYTVSVGGQLVSAMQIGDLPITAVQKALNDVTLTGTTQKYGHLLVVSTQERFTYQQLLPVFVNHLVQKGHLETLQKLLAEAVTLTNPGIFLYLIYINKIWYLDK